ncbi:MAG: SAM-dependent methyltransferase [Myxococcota bacterium]|jgi:SAM-dependent methyltransferase
MDPTTRAVRAQYDRWPYPGTGPQLRLDTFVHWLRAQVEALHPVERVLDAGCGTGAALAPLARLHPGVEVVGLDLSREAVAQAAASAAGLPNVQLAVGSLTDPELPDELGTFDVIHASGMLHHLPDPAAGFRALARLLAPDGVLSVMVYGRFGRGPVQQLAEALALAIPADRHDPDERLALGRRLVRELTGRAPVASGTWADAATCTDAEFADRYLHPHAVTYTAEGLLDEAEAAGLRLLRWLEPRAWNPREVFTDPAVVAALEALPERQQWAVIERAVERPGLEALFVGPHTRPRAPLHVEDFPGVAVAWNPQATLEQRGRRYGASGWAEGVRVRVRTGPWETLTGLEAAVALGADRPAPAGELAAAVASHVGGHADPVLGAIAGLVQREVLYRP